MKYPLAAPLAALVAGIIAAQFAPFSLRETLLSILLLAGLSALGLRYGATRAAVVACLTGFVLTGAMLASRSDPPDPFLITAVLKRESARLEDPIRLRGYVRVPPRSLRTRIDLSWKPSRSFVTPSPTVAFASPCTAGRTLLL